MNKLHRFLRIFKTLLSKLLSERGKNWKMFTILGELVFKCVYGKYPTAVMVATPGYSLDLRFFVLFFDTITNWCSLCRWINLIFEFNYLNLKKENIWLINKPWRSVVGDRTLCLCRPCWVVHGRSFKEQRQFLSANSTSPGPIIN